MGFVHHHEIPLHLAQVLCVLRGERIGRNQDSRLLVWICEPLLLQLVRSPGIYDLAGKVELVLKLALPLLAERCRTHDEDAALALCPKLADDETRLDRFAEAHFIRQQRTA